jgi:hypothetical protein
MTTICEHTITTQKQKNKRKVEYYLLDYFYKQPLFVKTTTTTQKETKKK